MSLTIVTAATLPGQPPALPTTWQTTMKAITIHQPWAWAIIAGHKRVENRTWPIRYRGPLAIHAGLSHASEQEGRRVLADLGIAVPDDLVYGAILGVVDLVGCLRPSDRQRRLLNCQLMDDPLATGPWCWVLANPRPLFDPEPCRGQQAVWEADVCLPCDPCEVLIRSSHPG